ncbi:MAG: hypothetical protein ABI664_23780 [bacterium]
MTVRFRSSHSLAFALGAAILFVAPLRAQDASLAAPVSLPVASVVTLPAAPAVSGPTMDAATVAVKNTSETKAAAPAAPGKYYDQGTKLMIIGGAAILTGIVVGSNAGHAISIVGAVVGLYGLYKYLE